MPDKRELNVLLLQGPVGFFFKALRKHLHQHNINTWRICFNAGDKLFTFKEDRCVSFSGTLDEWSAWLSEFIQSHQIDCIVLFGCRRPLHTQARYIATQLNIRVIALEEGYIRPGFITAEDVGNNGDSLCAMQYPPDDFVIQEVSNPPKYRGSRQLALYSLFYYITRSLFSSTQQKALCHKPFHLLTEMGCWLKNVCRFYRYQHQDKVTKEQLIDIHTGKYFLVALQVSNDCQLKHFSADWSSRTMCEAILQSAVTHLPHDHLILFKVHPFERGYSNQRAFIHRLAKKYHMEARVCVIETGKVAALVRCSAGVMTINSTVGLSAIYHGVPLLVFGHALYSHPKLASLVTTEKDIDRFWRHKFVAAEQDRQRYLNWITHRCLVHGDFYLKSGARDAVEQIRQLIISES